VLILKIGARGSCAKLLPIDTDTNAHIDTSRARRRGAMHDNTAQPGCHHIAAVAEATGEIDRVDKVLAINLDKCATVLWS
jgi:hypothetical protein